MPLGLVVEMAEWLFLSTATKFPNFEPVVVAAAVAADDALKSLCRPSHFVVVVVAHERYL